MPFIVRKTVTETFLDRVKITPDRVAFVYKPRHPEELDGADPSIKKGWKEVTFRDFYSECRLVSLGLMGVGIKPGDRVAILSNTRFEWSLSDMAILGASGVTVPIYPSITANDVQYILNHCEARIVFIEDQKQLQKLLAKHDEKPDAFPYLEKIITFQTGREALENTDRPQFPQVLTLQALKELGRREDEREPARFDRNLATSRPDDLLSICYTSGTTGIPKGAMITHDNMICVLEDCVAVMKGHIKEEGEVVLSFLPFSHIIGKVESIAIHTFGWKQAFAESMERLLPNFEEVRPTLIFSVPRVFEKAHAQVMNMVDAASPAKRSFFHWAMGIGRAYYEKVWKEERQSPGMLAQYQVAKKLVFDQIAKRFGGRLRFAICGGAPLPREIGQFFQIGGVQILEGYGLTETCGPVTLNTPSDLRFGFVGRPLPEVSVKIADDGEILVKSRKIFKGYFKMPEDSATALEGGWFHTGDIGFIDRDGFLKITDRKKDLIITSGGKNIAPQKIESMAKSYSIISHFVVHGDRRNYLTALITLDRINAVQFAKENQILFSQFSELLKSPRMILMIQKIVDEINKNLASFETIKKFVILPRDFTVESGELTPSQKVRRNFVEMRYKTELDSIYES